MLETIDETSPLEALVAQSDLTATPLNDTFKKLTNAIPQNDMSNSSSRAKLLRDESDSSAALDPVIVRDKDPNDITSNISLGFRQPSFSSLSDVIMTKDGKVVDGSSNNLNSINEEDPVIVFDSMACLSSLNNEILDAPIGLTVRQPSYVSLGQEIIPKGTTSLAEFKPIIEEVVPNTGEPVEENADDEIPQVHLIKDLKSKNLKRWREIGYEPPEDLIPLVRAASQSGMMIGTQLSSFPVNSLYSSNSQNNIYLGGNSKKISSNENNNNGQSNFLEPIIEDNVEEVDKKDSNISPIRKMKRSSSFGMKLGETGSTNDIIKAILGMSQQISEIPYEEEEEETEQQIQEESNLHQSVVDNKKPEKEPQALFNDNDEELVLFGHLNEINQELTDPPVYRILATGEVDLREDTELIRQRLKSIVDICADHLWVEETAYVNEILLLINRSIRENIKPARSGRGFVHDDPNAVIENLKEQLRKVEAETQEKIDKETLKKDNVLKDLDDEYMKEANLLDQKYQDPDTLKKFAKPSKDLMNLRASAKKLLKQNRIEEVPKITSRIRQLELEEQSKINANIREKYHSEDRALKERIASCRKIAIQRYEYRLKCIGSERLEKVTAIQKRIQNLENEIQEEEDIKRWKLNNAKNNTNSFDNKNNNVADQKSNQHSDFIETGALTLTPPKRLRRDADEAILNEMTKEMIQKGSKANEININTVMKKTQKKNGTKRPTRASSCRREKKKQMTE